MRTARKVAILLSSLVTLPGPFGSALENLPPPPTVASQLKSDDQLKTDVLRGIVANPEVLAADVRVEVVKGMVTLTGTVRSAEAKSAAGGVAKDIPGVLGVKNLLKVLP